MTLANLSKKKKKRKEGGEEGGREERGKGGRVEGRKCFERAWGIHRIEVIAK